MKLGKMLVAAASAARSLPCRLPPQVRQSAHSASPHPQSVCCLQTIQQDPEQSLLSLTHIARRTCMSRRSRHSSSIIRQAHQRYSIACHPWAMCWFTCCRAQSVLLRGTRASAPTARARRGSSWHLRTAFPPKTPVPTSRREPSSFFSRARKIRTTQTARHWPNEVSDA